MLCSWRGLVEVSSTHMNGSHPCSTPIPEDPMLSYCLLLEYCTHMVHVHRSTENTHMYGINIISLENERWVYHKAGASPDQEWGVKKSGT